MSDETRKDGGLSGDGDGMKELPAARTSSPKTMRSTLPKVEARARAVGLSGRWPRWGTNRLSHGPRAPKRSFFL